MDRLNLILKDIPLIDLRAPVEFAKGAPPNSINLPLMTDQERAKVGTCYKKEGQEAAIELGHQLVSGTTKDERLAAWQEALKQHPQAVFYCFRGGLRSQAVQSWLSDVGVEVPILSGGYKQLRSWLNETLENIITNRELAVLGGKTGCAKTELLHDISPESGRVIPIDLEGLANHRGSAFGRRVSPQPTQISFEMALASAVIKNTHKRLGKLLLEDESKLIGRCGLPTKLHEKMRTAPLILVEESIDFRVEHSFQNYILKNLEEWIAALTDHDAAFDAFSKSLIKSADDIAKRLGGQRHKQLRTMLDAALKQHLKGDSSEHRSWIRMLLEEYYDPMYDYQLSDKANRIVFRGSFTQVRDSLLSST
jgi:tRNA 2-selenouridine synthase